MTYLPTPAVVVTGYSALAAAVGLRKLARDGFFDGVPPAERAELLRVIAELEQAGVAWRRPAPASTGQEVQTFVPVADASDTEPVAELLTYREAAVALGVAERSVRRLVAAGALRAVRLNRLRRIRRCDLDEFIDRLKETA